MTSIRHHGIMRTEWARCAVCGFELPITVLRRQLGALKCPTCCDDLSIMYLKDTQQKILAIPGEGTSEQSEMFKDIGEIVEF